MICEFALCENNARSGSQFCSDTCREAFNFDMEQSGVYDEQETDNE